MNTYRCFEDLSNEIFFELFDYLHALDIFLSFTLLNKRISSILQSIRFRIVISNDYCRHQIDFLSSHLVFHAHQVISLKISDTIRDHSSIINLLFNRHKFINLESCIFDSITSFTKFKNIIQQIQSLNKLVSFSIYIQYNKNFNENIKIDLTRTILMHKSSYLRSVLLHVYHNDYLDLLNYTSIASNIQSLHLFISSSSSTGSVYSILLILRLCHSIKYLRIVFAYIYLYENHNVSQAPSMEDSDPLILSQLISFSLTILARCDSRSISYILRCMPNLRHFYFFHSARIATWPFAGELFDGYVWQEMLERYVPCLSKFELHMIIVKGIPELNLNSIVHSFRKFVRKFSNWHMIIDRWNFNKFGKEYVMLRTLNYHKHRSAMCKEMPYIISRSFDTRSTMATNDHYLFYPDLKIFRIFITKKRPTISWSSSLYPQINYLIIEIQRNLSIWNSLLNIINYNETNDNDAEQTITNLSHFVHLPNVTRIEFGSTFDRSQWKHIQFILQACPNVIELIISTRLLILSELIDNPTLISIFKKIKIIKSTTKNIYFPSNFASKFVQCFPSLTNIELQVFSFDNCVSVVDIFLNHLKNLSYIKINYYQDTLLDDPFSRDYIIEKRREIFLDHNFNEQLVNVKNNGETIEIWLR